MGLRSVSVCSAGIAQVSIGGLALQRKAAAAASRQVGGKRRSRRKGGWRRWRRGGKCWAGCLLSARTGVIRARLQVPGNPQKDEREAAQAEAGSATHCLLKGTGAPVGSLAAAWLRTEGRMGRAQQPAGAMREQSRRHCTGGSTGVAGESLHGCAGRRTELGWSRNNVRSD